MQTVAPTTTLHNTAGLFVHDLDLSAVDDIIHIFLEEGVGFEQLVNRMDTLGLDAVVGVDIVFALLHLVRRETGLVLEIRDLRSYVRQDEEIRVIGRTGEGIDTLIGEFDGLILLIDDEEELVCRDMHVLLILLEVELFGLLETHLDTRLAQILDEGLGFGQTFEGTEEG